MASVTSVERGVFFSARRRGFHDHRRDACADATPCSGGALVHRDGGASIWRAPLDGAAHARRSPAFGRYATDEQARAAQELHRRAIDEISRVDLDAVVVGAALARIR